MAVGGTGVFGAYTTGANPISALAQTDVLAQLDKLKALIPNPAVAGTGANAIPDIDEMNAHVAVQLRKEIDALKTAIDATATA